MRAKKVRAAEWLRKGRMEMGKEEERKDGRREKVKGISRLTEFVRFGDIDNRGGD